MQGLADGYFVLPYTIADFLATHKPANVSTEHEEFVKAKKNVEDMVSKLMSIQGKTTVEEFHRKLGKIMWDKVGMSRNAKGLQEAITEIRALREEYWKDVKVVGAANDLNNSLERASRVADFLELGELMAIDALHRNESCGGHFREEYQTPENEALRDDENFSYVAAWEFKNVGDWELNKEPLVFENIQLSQRSYK
jgi:succinate dehydrogenase / fumarate reductase flavoprotein subunit